MQLVVYPLLHVLLYLSLLLAPRDANHVAISGPDVSCELVAAQDGWTARGPDFPDSADITRDGDNLVIKPKVEAVKEDTFEVGSRVRAILIRDKASSAVSRWELDADHVVEKTPDGFRFLVNPGRPDEKEYRVAYRTVISTRTTRGGPTRNLTEPATILREHSGVPAPSPSAPPVLVESVQAGRAPAASAPMLRANVLGAVARPGAYSLPVGATATEALVAAGDVNPRADLPGSIILRGAGGELPQVIPFNPGVIRRGEAVDVPLLDRDTLYVPPQRKLSPGDGPQKLPPPAVHIAPPPPIQAPREFEFGSVKWQAWRTLFEITSDKELVSLPVVRPGFDYGHGGHGRGPEIITHIGDPAWRDYRIDADLVVPGVDPRLNPHGLGLDFHGAMIAFHVADRKESFNDCGTSAYILGFEGPGNWGLTATRNNYCRQPKGWGNPGTDYDRKLAGGSDIALDPTRGNRFRIEVRGQRIQIWIDGRQIVDVVDEDMGKVIGGQALDHGGVAFVGGFDAMIRLRSFEITHLSEKAASPGRKSPRK